MFENCPFYEIKISEIIKRPLSMGNKLTKLTTFVPLNCE